MQELNNQPHPRGGDREKLEASLRAATIQRLSYHETYLCPVCRHGQISELVLMDAFSCNFCRHIFTADLQNQTVRVEDSSYPMTWRWTGRKWQSAGQSSQDVTIAVWLVAVVLVLLPPSLIWLSSHIFPPLQDGEENWFPTVWVGLTFAVHFLFVAWVLLEHYQVPLYVSCKIRLQDFLGRR